MGNLASHFERCCRGGREQERESAVVSKYAFYKVFYVGAPRDHTALFVETEDDGSGYMYHVTGSVIDGMRYEHRQTKNPAYSATFQKKENLGYINQTEFESIGGTLQTLTPPPKQYRGFVRIDPKKPLIRCQEWTNEAIELLATRGIITTDF